MINDNYHINKYKPWYEWLVYVETFKKPGKQGLVGLFEDKHAKDDKDDKDKNVYVFKVSQYINYLIQHECVVMNGLSSLLSYCPHFCNFVGMIEATVDPQSRKTGNPFEPGDKVGIKKEVLLCEYIKDSMKLYNYIRAADKIPEFVLYSLVKQTLLAIAIAQSKKGFSHYDLHSNNIMVRKCDGDMVMLYILDEDNQFCVPTYGYYPVIIDYGFSYIEDMDDGPMWPSMAHTDVGFMSDRFDWVADPKLFLVTVSSEIKSTHPNSQDAKTLRNITKNIFSPLNIDWDSGWDKDEEMGCSDYISRTFRVYENYDSILFTEYEHYCLDILQTLIILPLEEQEYRNKIQASYETFLREWVKIEKEISSPFYNLYVLKNIVDSARKVRPDYNDTNNRSEALTVFSNDVYGCIQEIAKFCVPKKLNLEIMLCSLLLLGRNLEGAFYDRVTARMRVKEKAYKKLYLNSVEQIYGVIEANITSPYVYSDTSTVMVINAHDETPLYKHKITQEQAQELNKLHPMSQGTYIYDAIK